MTLASETVRAFLESLGTRDDVIEAGLGRTDDLRVVQDLRFRVIALAKARRVTGDRLYAAALGALDALLRGGGPLATDADALFRSAAARHAALESASDAAVTRWEWWTGEHHDLEPYRAERHRFARGKQVPAPATQRARDGLEAYGFDAAGRVRVQRSHNSLGFDATFTTHAADRIEQTRYGHHAHEPINAVVYRLEGGRLVERHCTATHGSSVERYAYAGACLARISALRSNQAPQELACRHDARGDLERIDDVSALDPRYHEVLWQRPTRGVTLATLLPKIRARVLELLLRALAKHPLASPAYALALVVDSEAYDHLLPPSVAIATATERDAFLAKHGASASEYLWSPPEWDPANALELSDDAMEALVTPANQLLWASQRYAAAMRLATDLATELNTRELPLARTEDFVVFACELDGADGIAGIKKAAPAALRKRLAAQLVRPRR